MRYVSRFVKLLKSRRWFESNFRPYNALEVKDRLSGHLCGAAVMNTAWDARAYLRRFTRKTGC